MPSMPEISNPEISNQNIRAPKINSTNKQKSSSSNSTDKNNSNKSNLINKLNTGTLNNDFSGLTAASLLQLGNSNSLSALSQLGNIATPQDNSYIILNQIIEQLNRIEKQLANQNSSIITNISNDTHQSSSTEPLNKIIKFKINHYDISNSFINFYISQKEENGNFLICLDREYFVNNKKFSESVYFICQKLDDCYNVLVNTNQSNVNKNSFLYKLSQNAPYKAILDNNLFKVITEKPNQQIEILFQLNNY